MNKCIKVEYKGDVAVMVMNRPEKLNPLDIEAAGEILKALDDIETRGIRALLITGTGKGFSAGGDIKGMLDSVNGGEPEKFMDDLTRDLYAIGLKLRKLPFPVIAAVNGYAAGAGMNLALCCDYIIASESAKFAQSFSKIALIPGFGGTHLLINQLPWQKACEIAFTGEPFTAEEMMKIGFVNEIVTGDELPDAAMAAAEKFAQGPTLTYARTKELFLKGIGASFEEHLNYERMFQVKSAGTGDYAEGVRALNSKREPEFKGQ
ncbi:MAG TPA: enoyl-CoA hydratase/isomerase family protein [Spirochaetota bacterium]|nr:enoyl-CoA hydratase/isomerase family protein [Spirochaetota bacterium]HPF05767.1 enoyl-CoA hydratase/isomerase family protein [Spirochaetota bacterium]HPJ42486.1 enoyl-CoA hydratase/isomerase family protein [Spirochaetota bacterium]HPR37419.1 enoyl-CoA hydratase/isomerase family protein [Spirochaetota bacterium]HRX47316.1 enoyl-CoA hydratase/isomerase family protein [Spirochaetota bacterium]